MTIECNLKDLLERMDDVMLHNMVIKILWKTQTLFIGTHDEISQDLYPMLVAVFFYSDGSLTVILED